MSSATGPTFSSAAASKWHAKMPPYASIAALKSGFCVLDRSDGEKAVFGLPIDVVADLVDVRWSDF